MVQKKDQVEIANPIIQLSCELSSRLVEKFLLIHIDFATYYYGISGLQGISYQNGTYELALTDKDIQVKFGLKMILESLMITLISSKS